MMAHNGGQIDNAQLITGVVNTYKIALLKYIQKALQVFYKVKNMGGEGRVDVNQGQIVDVYQIRMRS